MLFDLFSLKLFKKLLARISYDFTDLCRIVFELQTIYLRVSKTDGFFSIKKVPLTAKGYFSNI